MNKLYVLLMLGCLRADTAHAQFAEGTDDALGFGASTLAPAPARELDAPATPPSELRLTGSVRLQSAMRLERSGVYRLATLRQVLVPRLEYRHDLQGSSGSLVAVLSGRGEADFAYLLRPQDYGAPTLETYGSQLIVGESYLRLEAPGFELALGEQIVNFGQGEVLSLLDVVNPRDLREPLSADVDQLRLPLLMTRVGVTVQRFRGDLLVVHEPYFGLLAPPLGEFSPFRKLLEDNPALGSVLADRELYYQHVPARDLSLVEASQFHARLAFSGGGLDLSLQASSLLDSLGIPGLPAPAALASQRIDLPLYHPRYALLGHGGAFSVGPVLLRWELGSELNRPLLVQAKTSVLPDWSSQRLNTVRGMLGITYVPNGRSNLALELLQTLVLDNPDRQQGAQQTLLFPVEATQLALRASQQLLRERLTLTVLALCIGLADFNAFGARFELGYALLDSLKLGVGVVTYQPSQQLGPFYGFERNDRMFASLRWDFAAQ